MNKIKSILVVASFFICSISYGQGPPDGAKRGNRPSPKEMIKKYDLDLDGKISFAEAQQVERGPLKKDFKAIDKNEDGFVTLKEFKAFKPKRRRKGGND